MKKVYFLILFIVYSCNKDDKVIILQEESIITPKMKTSEIADLTIFSVQIAGEIESDRGLEITETGFLVGDIRNPTLREHFLKLEIEPSLTGQFEGKFILQGLPASTTLYIRSYGINENGVGYGNEVSFTTLQSQTYNGGVLISNQNELASFIANGYNIINGTL